MNVNAKEPMERSTIADIGFQIGLVKPVGLRTVTRLRYDNEGAASR
jgi:hypothetical protein